MKKLLFIVVPMTILLTSCENTLTRKMGGSMTVDLPQGKKLVTCTWKDDNFWYLERNAKPGETPETYTFKENSVHGLLQGTVTIIEH